MPPSIRIKTFEGFPSVIQHTTVLYNKRQDAVSHLGTRRGHHIALAGIRRRRDLLLACYQARYLSSFRHTWPLRHFQVQNAFSPGGRVAIFVDLLHRGLSP